MYKSKRICGLRLHAKASLTKAKHTRTENSPHNGVHSQVLLEPRNGLGESLLLRILDLDLVQITADSEAVFDAAEQIDLPGLTDLDEDSLGFVTQLGGEDVVGF